MLIDTSRLHKWTGAHSCILRASGPFLLHKKHYTYYIEVWSARMVDVKASELLGRYMDGACFAVRSVARQGSFGGGKNMRIEMGIFFRKLLVGAPHYQ